MNILISNDHAGTELKKEIVEHIKAKGHSVKNYGDDSGESVDYPDFIHPLAKQVSENNEQTGIIICGSGNGVSMVANKYKGVRAAICWNKELASLQDNTTTQTSLVFLQDSYQAKKQLK